MPGSVQIANKPPIRKFSIIIRLALPLISIGFLIYATTAIIPTTKHPNSDNQAHRSLMASIDILVTTAIANAVVLTSLINDRGFKKSKWKWEVIATGQEHGGSGRSQLRKIQQAWDAKEGMWRNDTVITAGLNPLERDVERGGAKRKKSTSESVRSKNKEIGREGDSEDSDFELMDLSKVATQVKGDELGVRMEGVERPERARLLGEIRVAREWEVTTSR